LRGPKRGGRKGASPLPIRAGRPETGTLRDQDEIVLGARPNQRRSHAILQYNAEEIGELENCESPAAACLDSSCS
jgi:hypothetical protein